MQVHEEEFIDFGNQSSNKWNQKGVRFCLLLDRSAQDALQLAQEIAGLRLVCELFGLEKGV